MASKILHKRSSVANKTPTTIDLDFGELAINTYDGKVFTKKNDGSGEVIFELLTNSSSSAPISDNTYSLGSSTNRYKDIYAVNIHGSLLGTASNADTLDGHDSTYFLPASSYTASDVLNKIKTVDGTGSGLDADTLDGHDSTYFLPASTYNNGFTAVKNTIGCQKFPSGVIIQWGVTSVSSGYKNVTLPLTYTTTYTLVYSGSTGSAYKISNSVVRFSPPGSVSPTTITFNWMTIGY